MVRSWHFKWGTTEGAGGIGFSILSSEKGRKKDKNLDGSCFYELDVW